MRNSGTVLILFPHRQYAQWCPCSLVVYFLRRQAGLNGHNRITRIVVLYQRVRVGVCGDSMSFFAYPLPTGVFSLDIALVAWQSMAPSYCISGMGAQYCFLRRV